MKDYVYTSSLAVHLHGFIDYKRALGYKYDVEGSVFKVISSFQT